MASQMAPELHHNFKHDICIKSDCAVVWEQAEKWAGVTRDYSGQRHDVKRNVQMFTILQLGFQRALDGAKCLIVKLHSQAITSNPQTTPTV